MKQSGGKTARIIAVSPGSIRPALVLAVFCALVFRPAHAQQPTQFKACEALPGLTPVQAMLFAGNKPEKDHYELSEQPTDDGGQGLIETEKKPPTQTYWDMSDRPKPYYLVCGYVKSTSKAATDDSYLGTDPDSTISKHTDPPISVPDNATKCTIKDKPGPNPDDPIMTGVVCDLKPVGARKPQMPNRS